MAETDSEIRDILERCETVAVVGIKDLETEDAYRVPQYLQTHGYRIVPVNPKLDNVLGHSAHPGLPEVEEPIDLVSVFRASDHIPAHVDEILAMSPRPAAVWLQLGIQNGAQAARLRLLHSLRRETTAAGGCRCEGSEASDGGKEWWWTQAHPLLRSQGDYYY